MKEKQKGLIRSPGEDSCQEAISGFCGRLADFEPTRCADRSRHNGKA
jgi:hypothetical protein